MAKQEFLNCPNKLNKKKSNITQQVKKFCSEFDLLEKETLYIFVDLRTDAFFCECHISARNFIEKSTIDVPLDPENQPEYRANRNLVEGHTAYEQMIEDANKKRMFSNVVCEYNLNYEADKPLKIIGGQHRFLAIQNAYDNGIDEYHGVKVYFDLDTDQRLDVQLISNTNIAVSTDLLDRMFETAKGPELRNWCQKVGILERKQDFSDKKQRGSQISVRGARAFILNYVRGAKIGDKNFESIDTTPILPRTGEIDSEWEKLRTKQNIWKNKDLEEAGKEFSKLHKKQFEYFQKKGKQFEFSERALSYSFIVSWAFVAGILKNNRVRLKRHFDLSNITATDPLNSPVLSKASHKTDPDNYRGLGTRTDAKDRGRLVELFFLQAEKGGGFNKTMADLAIKKISCKII